MPRAATHPANVPVRYMQGVAVPETSVNGPEFFHRTRRNLHTESARTFAGLGGQDGWQLKRTGIVSGITVRFSGSVTATPGAGTVATTARWPYDLFKQIRFTANGQTNLLSASGLKYKARSVAGNTDQDDRGVSQSVNGATVNQGTLANASEQWGVGSRETAIAAGTYDIELEVFLPVAEDQVDLTGAIFAASSSTSLDVTIDWAKETELFVLTGGATADVTGQVQLILHRYEIPLGADGEVVVPDLSLFHSFIETPFTADIGAGTNEVKMSGQGAGITLLRLFHQLWNGAAPQVPVVVNGANFGRLGYRYSTNETPEEYQDGALMRMLNERAYNSDIGGVWGLWCHDFAIENAFRDAIDLGTMSEFRTLIEVLGGVALNAPRLEMVAETVFVAGAGS